MKGAEQVRVFLKGRQVDAAGEESRITLSVRAVLAVHADATPACAQLPGRGGGSVYFLYALCGRDASERQHDGNTN